MRRNLVGTLLSALLVAGCTTSSHDEKVVFAVQTGFSQGGPATTADVLDLGIPLLHNVTGDTVQLRWVRLAERYDGMQVQNVTAYKYSQVGEGINALFGDLRKYCKTEMTPYSVGGKRTRPHADSDWLVVIALTFSKPGRYHIKRAKIGYKANGFTGWQYQNLNTLITVHKANPGTKPKLSGCG